MIRDLRAIRTKLYHAARGKEPATLDADEANAVLKAMDRPSGIYECSFCGALVRSPAGLQDAGLEPLDPSALNDHAEGCSYVTRARAPREPSPKTHSFGPYATRYVACQVGAAVHTGHCEEGVFYCQQCPGSHREDGAS